ncbi:MAG: hypothetical protein GW748_01730 [Alphaproteobacteria bacterium]|nr:hypothetical protein [Alphaproteobacteria bacterium]NCQ66451.1 hypothetical protein [Alphaproteobacteria bacterium]
MNQNNFEPDYKAYFDKVDLKKEEVCWLILGINPNDAKKYMQEPHTEDNAEWRRGFVGYLNTLPHSGWYINKLRHEELSKSSWDGDMKRFIKTVYEEYWEFPEGLKTYLVKSDTLKLNPKLESYKDHEQFKYDFKNFEIGSIDNEDKALSILFGVNEEQFIGFRQLQTTLYSEIKNPADKNEVWAKFLPDNKWVHMGYMEFLVGYYEGHVPAQIIGFYEEAKKLQLWEGDFKKYCQNLYDEGFIFKEEVVRALEEKGIKFEYSDDAWALNFYRYWQKKGGVTLSEAIPIFKGQSPTEGERSFHDLSQNPYFLSCDPNFRMYWETFKEDFEDLDELLSRHVSVQKITEYQWYRNEGEALYRPEDIMPWLMKNTLHIPPKSLVEILDIHESDEEKEKRVSNIKQSSSIIKDKLKTVKHLKGILPDLMQDAILVWHEFEANNNRKPTKAEIAEKLIEKHNLRFGKSYLEREINMGELTKMYQTYKVNNKGA